MCFGVDSQSNCIEISKMTRNRPDKRKKPTPKSWLFHESLGGLGRNRTADTRIFNLYHFYAIEQTLLKILWNQLNSTLKIVPRFCPDVLFTTEQTSRLPENRLDFFNDFISIVHLSFLAPPINWYWLTCTF